jgi:hypothetical protein
MAYDHDDGTDEYRNVDTELRNGDAFGCRHHIYGATSRNIKKIWYMNTRGIKLASLERTLRVQ